MNMPKILAGIAAALAPAILFAGVSKDLPLPSGTPSADEIADQVYFVNHFYPFKNYGIEKEGRTITVLISKSEDGAITTNTLTRWLNNNYPGDGEVNSKDLAIFHSGKLRGTGMLITDFTDDDKSQSYSIWLPALRKIRRFAQPSHDDAWGGSDFTFGDVTLRKPFHETHELLGKDTFNDCLGSIENIESKWLPEPPKASCIHKGKEVYKLKSTTKFKNWWYDHRIQYVDTKTFADYRSEYFKGGEQVKVIDRDWLSLNQADPRGQSWGYWYGKDLKTNHETWAVIPQQVVQTDADKDEGLWSERTLRKIKR
ncbi:MAG: outer membrane lipoprotein-sorting protein [Pseudomonadota bacterium]